MTTVQDWLDIFDTMEPWVEVITEHGRTLLATITNEGLMIGEVCEMCEELPCLCKREYGD